MKRIEALFLPRVGKSDSAADFVSAPPRFGEPPPENAADGVCNASASYHAICEEEEEQNYHQHPRNHHSAQEKHHWITQEKQQKSLYQH